MEEKISLNDLIKIVQQPDFSKTKLLEFQKQYNLDSIQFLFWHREGIPLPIEPRDINNWLFHLEMFIRTEGDILELLQGDSIDNQLELIA